MSTVTETVTETRLERSPAGILYKVITEGVVHRIYLGNRPVREYTSLDSALKAVREGDSFLDREAEAGIAPLPCTTCGEDGHSEPHCPVEAVKALSATGVEQGTQSPRRWVRKVAIGVLIADVVALSVTGVVVWHRSGPAPVRGTVVESRCIDGRISQSIDDANPAGLLAYDTGVSC